MSVVSLRSPLCWVIAHARGNPDGASEVDEWLRTATCVRDNLMKIQGQVGGFCGEAAYALAHLIDGTVVLGSYQFRGKPSEFENPHYWVEKEGYIIDPTAEQYGEFEGPIVIKTGDKHYVYTEDTFRDEPSKVRKVIERGFIDPAISVDIIRELLKASCTAGIGLSKRKPSQGLVIEGWHSSPTGELGISDPEMSTEGVGYYVALEKETAQFFGRVVEPVSITLFNPLDARGEPGYILLEEDVVMEPPRPGDSEWLSAIKEAVSRSGTTDENWGRNQARLHQALTDVLQDRGYDGIIIEDWAVKFASPEERAGMKGYLKSENPTRARGNPDASPEALIEECKAHFGTTKDPSMAGYLLPDGSMLDFGRKKRWERIKPHGAISRCLPEYGEISYDDAMEYFMRETGALRIAVNPDTGYVYWEGVANVKPTSAQARILGRLCRKGVPGFRPTMSERASCEWSIRKVDGSNCEWSRAPTSWPEYMRAWERCSVK